MDLSTISLITLIKTATTYGSWWSLSYCIISVSPIHGVGLPTLHLPVTAVGDYGVGAPV